MEDNGISEFNHQHKFSSFKQITVKLTAVAYGAGIMIVSALIHFAVQPGIDSCNSMAGIVLTYTSKDYSTGCHTLLTIQLGALASGLTGAGVVILGILGKPKIK